MDVCDTVHLTSPGSQGARTSLCHSLLDLDFSFLRHSLTSFLFLIFFVSRHDFSIYAQAKGFVRAHLSMGATTFERVDIGGVSGTQITTVLVSSLPSLQHGLMHAVHSRFCMRTPRASFLCLLSTKPLPAPPTALPTWWSTWSRTHPPTRRREACLFSFLPWICASSFAVL